VKTRIHESDRNKPGGIPDEELADPEQEAMREALAGLLAGGMTPEQVAAEVAEAIRENRFWIRTHPAMEANVKERCEAIIAGAMPPAMLPMEIQ
jgi:hypothetical protein